MHIKNSNKSKTILTAMEVHDVRQNAPYGMVTQKSSVKFKILLTIPNQTRQNCIYVFAAYIIIWKTDAFCHENPFRLVGEVTVLDIAISKIVDYYFIF